MAKFNTGHFLDALRSYRAGDPEQQRRDWEQLEAIVEDGPAVLPVHGGGGFICWEDDHLLRVTTQKVWDLEAATISGQAEDSFVGFDWRGDQLWANTWSGWRVRLDPETGAVLEKEFVK
jgi:hypothetical protein